MTKHGLIKRLAKRHKDMGQQDIEIAVKIILEAIQQSLVEGRHIEIRGFGGFRLNFRASRIGRNPKSGAPVKVPAKYVPHFRAGKNLRVLAVDSRKL